MKACIFNPYLETLGGGERYTVGVINSFSKKGYKVYIEWKDESIVEKLEKRFGVSLEGVKAVESIERGDGYDACFWVSDGSIPTLRSRNNILHFQVPFTNTSGRTLMNRMKLFRIKQVVCNSEFTKNFIDREYGVNSKVVYPPVSVSQFKPGRKQNLICYIGRFSKLTQQKRQDVLIEVFKKFLKVNKNWKLVLAGGAEVGNGDFTQKLAKMARGYPIEIVLSPSFSEVKEIMGSAKLFWSASGYGIDENKEPGKVEHFGITVVEAMAARVIPLVHNKGGHKETVVHGENGYLWDKKSELLRYSLALADNYKSMKAMSVVAHRESKKYSEDAFVNEFTKLI